ncbi:protein-methionine-sulfoxide reductase heme-binding subunit MsrQ [Tropicimonas isoalkanivorans]|uniref:Protein-methionine-sulfoxide reductase heme-binding subunit MsrQ n=1 Tax=Tropicimonas isoalkanivorans TaxID=441112 RepID=A0A1I1REH6_9RHOB|nr:protein-methionine-sulfoxide reductase heme-binding subunit MsrQ [Tropicimonas isoalkanivorans]SFD32642.1 sulfoxide reductase heme-binding subunit YedZ [Tropicimonas isoalkanivorans]
MLVDRLNKALRAVPAWPLYVAGALPVIWLFYRGLIGGLGVDPVKVIEHRLGLWGLWLLIAGLAVTPLGRFTGVRLIRYRRAIGLLAFFYILTHLLVWLVLDVQIPRLIWADIVKRPYITIGMAAFVLMIPLALTSNTWSVRKLGALRWRQVHKLTYVVVPLGAIHYVMVVKGWEMEPFYYLATVLALLGLRLVPKRRRAPMPGGAGRPARS